jgi:hypothetical protein
MVSKIGKVRMEKTGMDRIMRITTKEKIKKVSIFLNFN